MYLARAQNAAYQASGAVRSPLIRRVMSALIAAISASPRERRGVRIGSSATNPRRSRRQQEQPIAEANRLVNVVGDQQCRHATAVHQHGDLIAQVSGEGVVERCQRFVENEEVRLDREGAGERDPAGEAER